MREKLDHHQLLPLHASRSAGYTVTLFFQPDKLSYYVVLLHGDAYWRVVQTDAKPQAESIYGAFVRQAETLAEVEIDALRLQAGNIYAQRMVALNAQRLQNLQRDIEQQRRQAIDVAAEQQRARQRATALSRQLLRTSMQLDALKARIRALDAQQADPETTLPMRSNVAAPAAADPVH